MQGLSCDSSELAIYVHWPFCLSKCPYCDFNSHVRDTVDHDRWRGALLSELDHYADRVPGRTVTSIFFGGGTPSLMEPSTAAAIIDRVAERWAVAPDLEITLEANPSSVEAARFADLAAAGVNRVSLGVQALDDASLRFLGRRHNAAEAMEALAVAKRQFARTSFDPDLCPPRPDSRSLAHRIIARAGGGHRAPLCLSTDHRGRHEVRDPGGARRTRHAGRRYPGRALRDDTGHPRIRRPARLRNFQPRPAGCGIPP